MKGAIGNAFILNIVITFIIIFLLLVVGSMAYTKAYKVKNFLLNSIVEYEERYNSAIPNPKGGINALDKWNEMVNPYLQRSGYIIATKADTCPKKENYVNGVNRGYSTRVDTRVGQYEYCIYHRYNWDKNDYSGLGHYNYMVLVYMKLDLPIIGDFIKIPITGETKTFVD